jgi:hypothetical protein
VGYSVEEEEEEEEEEGKEKVVLVPALEMALAPALEVALAPAPVMVLGQETAIHLPLLENYQSARVEHLHQAVAQWMGHLQEHLHMPFPFEGLELHSEIQI